MSAFAAAARLQLRIIRNDPDYVMPLVTVPLYTITFLAIVRHAGREDLTDYALMAPVLIALWAMSLLCSGEVVADDRWTGSLELAVAAPASYPLTVLARVLTVTGISLVAFAEAWFVARLGFGISVAFPHPTAFVLTILVTVLAMTGTALIMAALFVLTRTTRTFQNSLSFPFYVLGGVLVPVSYLPDWIEPLSAGVFLSWSADLLRDSLAPAPVDELWRRLGMIALLGAAGFALGRLLLWRILDRVRRNGEIGLA
jgi:ABC-2 type transport system permease protein